MPEIVIAGGGMCGLLTGVLLARDGRDVTVVERDAMEPPADADAAWADWERRGVNQFRLLHYLQPRFRLLMLDELPELADLMLAMGATDWNFIDEMSSVTGERRADDDKFATITGRRPVIESAIAQLAAKTPGLTVRRGSGVAALLNGATDTGAVPRVTGVRTEDGEEVRAELVIDAMGRRSSIASLLETVGARPPVEEMEDSGFVYYGRHFRSADGSLPEMRGSILTHLGTISVLTLPADNGTWGIGLITSSRDAALRPLKDADVWNAVVQHVPDVAHWIDAEPLGGGVDVMARIPDRHREFVVEGAPNVSGLVAVADAWACTNPSVGRGITIGLIHALALRDTVRAQGLDDGVAFCEAFYEATMATAEPWYRATLELDRGRLAEIHALLDGAQPGDDDPSFPVVQAMTAAARQDPDVIRWFSEIGGMLSTPSEVFAREGVFEKVLEYAGQEVPNPMTRDDLLKIVA